MLSVKGRKPIAVVVEPLARGLLALKLTPNTVTVLGTIGMMVASVTLIPTGHFWSALIVGIVVSSLDLLDGTMARLRGGGTKFGATLDASCDRLSDGVLFASFAWWEMLTLIAAAHGAPNRLGITTWTLVATLIVLITSPVISYIKARAEASGLSASGGIVERAERIIGAGVALILLGLGVPFGLDVVMWLLAAGSVITVIQRLYRASTNEQAQGAIAPPEGA